MAGFYCSSGPPALKRTWEIGNGQNPLPTVYDLNGVWGSSGSDVFAVGAYGTIPHYDGAGWSAMTSGTTEALLGVWGSSGSDVFAVGAKGTILHYDGWPWSPMSSGPQDILEVVWGTSFRDLFAVGTGGTILHCGGSGHLLCAHCAEAPHTVGWAVPSPTFRSCSRTLACFRDSG